jgi:DNA-binding NtrC family response regulator
LGRVFDAAARPVYVIDAAGRIAYLNPACVEWLGDGADELVGVACRYGVAADANAATALAAGLCPPPEVFQGERAHAPVSSGTDAAPRRAEFIPLVSVDGSHDEQAVLAIVDEVTGTVSDAEPSLSDDSRALHAALHAARRALPGRYRPESLIGRSPAIRRVRRQVQVAAADRATVAIHGLPGSGRQHVARAIHYAQASPIGVFVPIACATLTPEMIFSYLAGLANNAQREPGTTTVVLQDVDALAPEVQEKLLARVQTIRIPLRWMTSSAAPLEDLASAGKFLPELAQLLSTLVIRIPSLSERLDDLPLVAQAFLEERNGHGGRQLSGFTPEALDVLSAHPPQGGWDELADWVREAHARATGQFIDRAALPDRVRYVADAGVYRRPAEETIDLEKFLGEIELELIERALAQAKGNKTKAAELLGMNRPKFYRRLEQLGLAESNE